MACEKACKVLMGGHWARSQRQFFETNVKTSDIVKQARKHLSHCRPSSPHMKPIMHSHAFNNSVSPAGNVLVTSSLPWMLQVTSSRGGFVMRTETQSFWLEITGNNVDLQRLYCQMTSIPKFLERVEEPALSHRQIAE
jgi:hypothetical protein